MYRCIFATALSCLLFAEFWFCSLLIDNRDSFLQDVGMHFPMATLPHFSECLNKWEQLCDIFKKYEVEGTKLLPAGGENEKIIIT